MAAKPAKRRGIRRRRAAVEAERRVEKQVESETESETESESEEELEQEASLVLGVCEEEKVTMASSVRRLRPRPARPR